MKQVLDLSINIHVYFIAIIVIFSQNVHAQSSLDKDTDLSNGMLTELSELANLRDILAENSGAKGLTGNYADEESRSLVNILGNDALFEPEDGLADEDDPLNTDKRARYSFYGARGKKFSPSNFYGARGKKFNLGFAPARGKRMSASAFYGSRGKRQGYAVYDAASLDDIDSPLKRYSQSAFFGARGKRGRSGMSSFFGVRGKKAWPWSSKNVDIEDTRGKKYASTFFGARGKKSANMPHYLDNSKSQIGTLIDTLQELNTLQKYQENDDNLKVRRTRQTEAL